MKLSALRALQLVQNAAVCLLGDSSCRECIAVPLCTSHPLAFEHRVQLKVSKLAFKAQHGTGPSDLSNQSPLLMQR